MTAPKHPATILAQLQKIAGEHGILTGPDASGHYQDRRGRYSGQALAVVFPAATQQVAKIVTLCVARGIAIVPQGGNTGLCGGSVPLARNKTIGEQIVLNLSRMNRVLNIDEINYTMTVEAGCTLQQARLAAEQVNRYFPLGLSAIAAECEIGGNLSTNAGGVNVLRYGMMRDLVLGLEVVLPDGRIWNGLRSLRKDNTGYDLKHLFIGAEGTLGIITTAVLKLFPRLQAQTTAIVAVRDATTAVNLLAHLRATCGDRLSAFEIISRSSLDLVLQHIPDTHEPFAEKHEWQILIDLADVLPIPLEHPLRDALDTFGDGMEEFLIAPDAHQAAAWWKLRKHISEAQKMEGISIKHDVSVPISRVAEFISLANTALKQQYPDVRIVIFGHIGDGNIHYNPSLPNATKNDEFIAQSARVNQLVYDIVHSLGGSISAEHGLGQLKRNEIRHYKSALEMELMSNIKRMLDPNNLMNPNKVL